MTRTWEASIELASTVAETGRLHAWLDGWLARASIPDGAAHALRLCLEEAVMNVILHGYGPGRPGTLEVALRREGNEAVATVSDGAMVFDPTAPRPEPVRGGLHDGPLGGRGLGLIRRYASHASYERRDGRNVLTLRFVSGFPA